VIYKGEWNNDKLIKGEYTNGKGDKYVGDFRDWKRHGKGIIKY